MANESRTNRHQKGQRMKSTTKTSKTNPQKKKGPKNFKTIFGKIFLSAVFIGCVLFLAGVALFAFYIRDTPKLTDNALDATVSSQLYASNNENFIDIGTENRVKIKPTDVPEQLADAIVSIEDKRFYKHIGVDPIRIVGSAVSNVFRGTKQGGSTLTQQLVKLSYFSTSEKDQTFKRKAQEAWLAIQLERKKSKQEILTYYINKVYMANGVYGMETASKTYYGKPLKELSLAQTALLAGLPNAPSYFDPYVNKEAAEGRRNLVLKAMLDNKKITKAEYETAIKTDISDGLQKLTPSDSNWKYYDNYIRQVKEEVKEKTGKDIDTAGLKVYTNLNIDAQKQLYTIVNSDQYVNYPDNEMQVASTLIDVATGKVVAQIGGRNVPEDTRLGTNLAVSTQRDFGSTVKPITDYGPAFQYLHYSTGKYITDEPYKYENSDVSLRNWDNQYYGALTLRRALALSRNVPAAKLFADVGVDDVSKFLSGLDIQYKSISQANAISSNTAQDGTKYGVSSLKMAAAYAAFANGGTYYKPQYVNKIVFPDGTEKIYNPEGSKAMDPGTAYMITDILKDVISGLGNNAAINGLYQAGKTGTSNYTDDQLAQITSPYAVYPDTTFVGFTPHYSMAVWIGYKNILDPVTSESAHVATDVYRELMTYVSSSVENTDWEMPSDLIRVGNELYFKDHYQAPVQPSTTQPSSSSTTTESSSTSSEISSSTSTSEESSSTTTSSQTSETSSSSATQETAQSTSSSDSSANQ
ncbi:PBP1A family penicillin-binding protein [Enterococcus camelliae]|uniref:PBP1A family penicillin-binding protein n=1 Tax=Enterococcus camelliae TaxID=453959 RepID=A0ABW5TL39_9ENTE